MLLLCEGIFISTFKSQADFAFMHCLEINNTGSRDIMMQTVTDLKGKLYPLVNVLNSGLCMEKKNSKERRK